MVWMVKSTIGWFGDGLDGEKPNRSTLGMVRIVLGLVGVVWG